MLWLEYIHKYKKYLNMYFINGCEKCIYKEINKHDTNQYLENDEVYDSEFEAVFVSFTGLYEHNTKNLCEFCLTDKYRDLESVILEILLKILKHKTSEEFNQSLYVLDCYKILKNPKEILFIHCVEQCRLLKTTKFHRELIVKLLQANIDEDYEYSKIKYNEVFTFLPLAFIETRLRDKLTEELTYILSKYGYHTIQFKRGIPTMSKLSIYVILG